MLDFSWLQVACPPPLLASLVYVKCFYTWEHQQQSPFLQLLCFTAQRWTTWKNDPFSLSIMAFCAMKIWVMKKGFVVSLQLDTTWMPAGYLYFFTTLKLRLLLIMLMECEFSIGSVSKQPLLMGYSKPFGEERVEWIWNVTMLCVDKIWIAPLLALCIHLRFTTHIVENLLKHTIL